MASSLQIVKERYFIEDFQQLGVTGTSTKYSTVVTVVVPEGRVHVHVIHVIHVIHCTGTRILSAE